MTGLTPPRCQHLLRLERAEHMIGHGATVESAARAVGFEDARVLRRLRGRACTSVPASGPHEAGPLAGRGRLCHVIRQLAVPASNANYPLQI